jgi:hypothetical protein
LGSTQAAGTSTQASTSTGYGRGSMTTVNCGGTQLYLNLRKINYYWHPYVELVEHLYRELRNEVDKSEYDKTTSIPCG